MKATLSRWLTRLSRALPPRLGASLYYRYLSRLNLGDAPFREVPLHFAPGFRMNLMRGDSCHGCIAYSGCYELPLTRRLSGIAREEGGTLIDAGANYGYYSLIWAAARPDNHVFAFEASPRNFPCLMANLELNGVADRVTAVNKAVGDTPGMVHFKMSDPGQSGWDKVTDDPAEADWSVPLTTLASELPDQEYTALKIDCEGYDHKVVLGVMPLLQARKIRHVFFEENPGCLEKFGVGAGEIGNLLESLGYQVFSVGGPTEYEASLS
ncbi:MAG: FkbM family methyltransferase [Verrucomicrobiaceae bacterium]|nr:FkbM family methyltransferase [Verrucomicrobiaceae bacterium]